MIGQHTKKNMGVHASLTMVPDRSHSERRFHVAKGVLRAGKQNIDPPEFSPEILPMRSRQMWKVGLDERRSNAGQKVRAINRLGYVVVGAGLERN